MLGRNELCPCGSGKKYKKCCLNKDVVSERASRKIVLSQKQYSQLYSKLYEYSRQEKFNEEYKKAQDMFYILDDENINKKFESFFNTYFIQDHIMENKKVITVDFFEENKNNLTKTEVDILKSLFESYVSVYVIKEKLEDKILLKDAITGDEIFTEDINLLNGFNQGDCIIARIAEVGGAHLLLDVTVSISEAVKDIVVNDINHFFNQYENLYKDIKTFLIYHTHILYKYIQQLLDPNIAEYLKNQKVVNEKKQEEIKEMISEDDCKVSTLLKAQVEADILQKCLDFWSEYKANNNEIKGSENGWAAAVEYHIRKENGQAVTQSQISKKYDISPSTLGKRHKDLRM
ncbi:SEC-C domain-containing protein [Paraclostridium sordellii]|uniref:SEC-C domain-containing protein n=1 Tax=Paraclostridium sordellii TaxID=1505 RepID=UPI0005E72A38|nr:SEC-C domain-containing protein [Paeniclostridium sordellii]CEP82025.1 protein translocase [[Clostridium] sordellii] [Paeniclostridium sordellii]